MTMSPSPSRLVRRGVAPVLVSDSRFRWVGRFGELDAVTGQVGTLTRAAAGTAVDVLGATYTAGHSMPRWESRDYSGSGRRYELGVRLAADDLTWPANWVPGTGTLLVDFSEAGTRTTANAGVVYVGNDAVSGARVSLDSDGTNYRATIHNGTTGQSVSLATVTPTTGQMTRLALQLDDDGTTQRVRLWLTVAGVETVSAWSATVARAAAFGIGAKLRLNRTGSAGTQGSTWVRQVAWCAGLLSPDDAAGRL
jgi:hypothetical protein